MNFLSFVIEYSFFCHICPNLNTLNGLVKKTIFFLEMERNYSRTIPLAALPGFSFFMIYLIGWKFFEF